LKIVSRRPGARNTSAKTNNIENDRIR
jgi:hypothetical protein